MERNVTLAVAAEHFGLSVDTLRKFIKGLDRVDGRRNVFEPILHQDIHWFRRYEGRNAPYLLRLSACEEALAAAGYYDPGAKESTNAEG